MKTKWFKLLAPSNESTASRDARWHNKYVLRRASSYYGMGPNAEPMCDVIFKQRVTSFFYRVWRHTSEGRARHSCNETPEQI